MSAGRRRRTSRPLALGHEVEDLGLHDVDAGVDGVGEHLAPCGLLEEPFDAPLLVDDRDAELERVGYALEADGDERAAVTVGLDERQ